MVTLESGTGRDAAGELAALLRRKGDHAGALDLYDRLASHPDIEAARRVQVLHAAGLCAEAAGDRGRARILFQTIASDYADQPKWANAVRKATEWLAEHP